MAQFISRNPVTATMQANEARNLQVDQINESRALRQEQRDQVTQRNELNSGLGKIFSEEQAAPVPVPDSLGGGPPAPSPIRSFGDKTREAIKLAAASPVGGETAFRLAQEGQKRRDSAQLAAMNAIHKGDRETAARLNQEHGLGLEGTLSNPNAFKVAANLIGSIPAKLEPSQVFAYQEAAAAKFNEVFTATRDYDAAYREAGAAGGAAARNAPQEIKHFATDDTGAVTGITKYGAKVPTEARGRTTRVAGGGPGGAASKATQNQEYQIKQWQKAINPATGALYTEAEATARVLPNRSGEITTRDKFRGLNGITNNGFTSPEDAAKTIEANAAAAARAPAASAARVRQYVPGKGFVDAQ